MIRRSAWAEGDGVWARCGDHLIPEERLGTGMGRTKRLIRLVGDWRFGAEVIGAVGLLG